MDATTNISDENDDIQATFTEEEESAMWQWVREAQAKVMKEEGSNKENAE